jgi:hypothetical protein
VLTLRQLGVNPERLVRAVEMLTWYNEQRHLAAGRKKYVSRDDRRAFIRAVAMLPRRKLPQSTHFDASTFAKSRAQFAVRRADACEHTTVGSRSRQTADRQEQRATHSAAARTWRT